ncbi:MAG: hypothetical protein HY015_07800 [Bacteroidetes bacterium]|nr:hypothetical protein [Bacteroidota bacterium]MBI3482862.1 hypothetical protein [Bacteroidota bacterium]
MAQENRVSIKIQPADLKKVSDAIKVAADTLKPYLVALTPVERQQLPKMSDGNIPFVQKSLEYAQANASFVPAYLDVTELKTDLDAVESLLQLFRPLEQLYQNLDDTMTLSGSEAYVAALAFYNSVKVAAKMKVPGAKAIAEDLSLRFAGQGKKLTKPTTNNNHATVK